MSFGVRNFTMNGSSTNPTITEFPTANYTNLVYPALNANSILIPPYVTVSTYNKGVFQQKNATANETWCSRFTDDYDAISLTYTG